MGGKPEQLLTVWNPWLEPQTIQVHVEILRRRQGPGPRRVWWARLYKQNEAGGFSPEAMRQKFWRLRELVDRAEKEGRKELVLYATNYQSLHALRVARVVFGSELPRGEEIFVPAYYERQKAKPALWFEIRDIRALSFDPMGTSRFFEDHPNEQGYSFDPYAAFWNWYPIPFRGPSVEEIFDPGALPERRELFADLPETIYPPEVEWAQSELASRFGADWARLEEKSRVFLSTAWLVFRRHGHLQGFDLSAVFSGVSRAMETEICESIFEPLIEWAGRRWGREAERRILGAEPQRITLGTAAWRLPELGELAGRLDLPALAALSSDGNFRSWLDGFVDIRNKLAHSAVVRPQTIKQKFEDVVGRGGASRLLDVLPAKEELADKLYRNG